MSSTADKAKGMANEAGGKVKRGVGKMAGAPDLEAKGAAQELKGKGQKAIGNAKEVVKKAGNF
jgi:uncharacterized protein YjbJ (UPF0337 family)